MQNPTNFNEFLLAILGMPENVVIYHQSPHDKLDAEQQEFADRFFRFFEAREAHFIRNADEELGAIIEEYRQPFATNAGTELLVFELIPKEALYLDSEEALLLNALYAAFPEAEAANVLVLYYEH
jgi:hypothetical protein